MGVKAFAKRERWARKLPVTGCQIIDDKVTCDHAAGISLADTVVAFPRLADYAAMVKRVFEQYEIPVTVYPATDLAASPPVLAVLELLRALDSGYERIATAAALGSPYLPLPDPDPEAQ